MEINYGDRVTNFKMEFTENGNYFYNNAAFWFHGNNWNADVSFPNKVRRVSVNNSPIFNGDVNIPQGVTDCFEIFKNDYNFNRTVNFPDSVISITGGFENCNLFDQNLTIPPRTSSISRLFANCTNLNAAEINATSRITNASRAFDGCENFQGINFVFDSGRVVNASNMFNACTMFNPETESIINISDNTISDCSDLFNGCYNFNANIYLTGGNCRNYQNAFRLCKNFYGRNSIISLSDNAVNCYEMFRDSRYYCGDYNYRSGEIKNALVIPENVEDCTRMFQNHTAQVCLDIRSKNIKNAQGMFNNYTSYYFTPGSCRNLFSGPIENCSYMFSRWGGGGSVDYVSFAMTNVNRGYCQNMAFMFNGCGYFNAPIYNLNLSQAVNTNNNVRYDMRHMFAYCGNFNQTLDITQYIGNGHNMFYGCTNLNSRISFANNLYLPLMQSDPDDYVLDMSGAFYMCWNYNQPMVFMTDAVLYVNSYDMFNQCRSFTGKDSNIYINTVNAGRMFENCYNLTGNDNCHIAIQHRGSNMNFESMFDGCTNFNPPDDHFFVYPTFVENTGDTFNTRVSFLCMFSDCHNFNSAPLGFRLDRSLYYYMNADYRDMFRNCYNLNVNVQVPGCTNCRYAGGTYRGMFQDCNNLTNVTLRLYNLSDTYTFKGMFTRYDDSKQLNVYVRNMNNSTKFMSSLAPNMVDGKTLTFTGSNPWVNTQYNFYIYSLS